MLLPVLAALPQSAHAQKDMVGPDWMAMVWALPKLVLYAAGELSLFLAPLFALFAIFTWIAAHKGGKAAKRFTGTPVFVMLAILTGVAGLAYRAAAPDRHDGSFGPNRSAAKKGNKDTTLAPPTMKPWPKSTGYLDMPQSAQGGQGVITVKSKYSAIYVKLCVAGVQPCPGLRHAFMRESSEFSFRDLPPGSYEVRFMPIDHPTIGGRSQPITFAEGVAAESVVTIGTSLALGSRDPIVGITPQDF
ncbi:MAG: hypothetical protein JNM79_13625 [Burkholderiales bacterium]|nr:hypothetical protein [Burkholderiales bacterium]